ncbi:peptidylprolyl isomerase [Novosphingobium soli]|uniref:peptidylprolyl isomerase n=1 Tax=Novosphingobium soli TaxID=574956 RepID=A0ABV6CUS3_9SPHN
MRKNLTCFLLAGLAPFLIGSGEAAAPRTPDEVVKAAPAGEWTRIAASDLLVMDLAPDGKGRARRVVIQLLPAPISQGWTGNIRRLVAARWFDEIAVVRTQDNYVVQWGDPQGEVPGKAKPLPAGIATVPESDYRTAASAAMRAAVSLRRDRGRRAPSSPLGADAYAAQTGFLAGWPVGLEGTDLWPLHCYGAVGVGRNLAPDTGTGAELYAVIGQAPRQLDRNIAVVGRVIAGMEHLSSLPRGTGKLGFYETAAERTPILSVRLGSEVAGLPAYEYLSTRSASFAAYVASRANRKDAFYVVPAGGVDICNAPVPIRAR